MDCHKFFAATKAAEWMVVVALAVKPVKREVASFLGAEDFYNLQVGFSAVSVGVDL